MNVFIMLSRRFSFFIDIEHHNAVCLNYIKNGYNGINRTYYINSNFCTRVQIVYRNIMYINRYM